MAISFELPSEVERHLREELNDLDHVAKESALVELYRQRKLSHHELATALGLGRLELDGVLKEHGVTEDSVTVQEFDDQVGSLRRANRK
jgi:hypothetical protein